MIQDKVFIVTVAGIAMVTAAFAFVALNASKSTQEYALLQARSYSIRAKFFWVLIVAGVLIAVMTTLDLPYAATRGNAPADAVVVAVDGRQWYWQLSRTEFKAGDTVVFEVTAGDVTHGLGVYDPEMRMIGQTQAMPGYSNALQLTLDKPGTYKLLCMEYCGLAHHAMVSEITVSE